MLKYRSFGIVIIALYGLIAWTSFFYKLPFILYCLPALVFTGVAFWGSYSIGSCFYLPVQTAGKTQKNIVSITFDDGPDPQVTPALLELLRKHKVAATFFCIGKKVEKHPEILKQIAEEGHILGNHSYSHSPWLPFFPKKKLEKELKKTDLLIEVAAGVKPRLFRPPFGVTSPQYAKANKKPQYHFIGWNIRSLDTVDKNKERVLDRITKDIPKGAIFLFHDTDFRVLELVEQLLNYVAKNGIIVVPLDELLNIDVYEKR